MDINEAVFRLGFYEVYRITILLFGMRSSPSPTHGKNPPLNICENIPSSLRSPPAPSRARWAGPKGWLSPPDCSMTWANWCCWRPKGRNTLK